MSVIATWTQIDCRLAELLSSLLDTPDLRIAMAMYQSLTGGDARRAALEGAASEALRDDDLLLFRAVMKAIRPSSNRRNDYAHHLWGISEQIPDALLLADPKAWVRHNTSIEVRLKALRDRARYAQILSEEVTEFDRRRVKVYGKKVLAADLADAEAASQHVLFLTVALSSGYDGDDPIRQMLLSEPAVRRALQELSPEKTPIVQPLLRSKTRPVKR